LEGAGRSSVSLGSVFRQTGITFQYSQGVVVHVVSGDVSLAEDLLEVLVGHGREVFAIFWGNAQYHGVGGQCFTIALGHVFGQLVHHAIHGNPGLAAVGQGAVGAATVGARGHAEGGVTRSTVGGGRQEVRWSTALAFKQHVAPTAVRAAWCFSHCIDGDDGEESTEKDPFHSFFLFVCKPMDKGSGTS